MGRIVLILFFILPCLNVFAQGNSLSVQLSNTHPHQGDTIWININYQVNNKPIPTASVFMVLVNDKGQIWNMRWPVLNGIANPGLIIPKEMSAGNYQAYFAARDNFFKLSGQVKSPIGLKQLTATLIAGSGDGIVTNLPLSAEGNFEYNNLLFEDQARLLFSHPKTKPDDLDINIKTELDSAFLPTARIMKEFFIGTKSSKRVAMQNLDSLFEHNYSLLPTVIVSSNKSSAAESLNKKYATGLFNDINAKTIIISEDKTAGNFSLLQYIQRTVPGIIIRNPYAPEPRVIWRNERVTFYLDELKVDASTANTVSLNDIIMIKAFSPPFYGNMGASGGAIAVYTKRSGTNQEARHNFTIQGYTPMLTELSATGSAF
jgi:hypothetical protein